MNAFATFPQDLSKAPAKGYVEINRQIALLLNGFLPVDHASRLVLRAAALQATAHNPKSEIVAALRAIACEMENADAGV